ncbi:MAG: hypothetical protein NTX61_09715 [Bacteroidetes bacterium]|nr:hypothetical protein [Bacteroidota bacterium]
MNNITSDQSSGQLFGIYTAGNADSVQGNTIRNFRHAGAKTGSGGAASVIGINNTSLSDGMIIRGNSIYNLANTHSSAAVAVQGITYTGSTAGANKVYGNLVHSLTLSPFNNSASVCGMFITGGSSTFSNNMISLGDGITGNNLIEGIYENCPAGDSNSVYFNSVSISGTAPSGATSNTFAVYNDSNANPRDYRNNIFQNSRSNASGTARHYAIRVAGNTALTIDYNDYSASGTGGVLGNYAGADKISLSLWQTATGQDLHSQNVSATFVSCTDLHIPVGTVTSLASGGTPISGITKDYDGEPRDAANPDLGDDEFQPIYASWTGASSTDWNTTTNWSPPYVPIDRTNVTIPNVTNQPIISTTGNKCLNVTIQHGASVHVSSGMSLIVGGNISIQP